MGKAFGEYLKKLRKDCKLTLRDVETRTGISNGYLSQVETGERKHPSVPVLKKIADAYGVPVSSFTEAMESELEGKEINENTPQSQSTTFLCRGFEALSERGQEDLLAYLDMLKDRDKKQ